MITDFLESFALLIRTAELSGLLPQRKEITDSESKYWLSQKHCLTLSAGLFIASSEAYLFNLHFQEIQPVSKNLRALMLLVIA